MLRDAEPSFSEKDRALFLEICGIRQLSKCVKAEPQTESLRPCPSMQALVRTVVPYIQRFLYHHDEFSEVYSELVRNNIGEKVKQLYFGQVRISQFVQNRLESDRVCLFWVKMSSPKVFRHTQFELCSGCLQVGKLYIRYELSDSELVAVQDVNCLLKDGKELYVQKDHLSAKLDICRCVSEAKVSACCLVAVTNTKLLD